MNDKSLTKQNIYFVGAGGIGMAALERYFLSRGCRVAGYDRTPTELTEALQAEGADIVFDDDTELIPADFRNPESTLVVFTPAVPESHRGLRYFRSGGFEVVKRAEALGYISRDFRSICVAGTHGKTTTSSMIAHLLQTAGVGCNAFLGGVLRNYGTNLLLSAKSPYAVIEADEFDRSFLRLSPWMAVVTSCAPDHLDIYGTESAYRQAFADFLSLVPDSGRIIRHVGLNIPAYASNAAVTEYCADSVCAGCHAENVRYGDGRLVFDFVNAATGRRIADIELGVPVEINVDNAVAAIAAVTSLEPDTVVTDDAIRAAMGSFIGAKRRFEFHLKEPQRAIIDDYAHHPDELGASIRSVKALYPGRKLTVAFQPHLYTRTRDFAPQFAAALSLADEVLLLPIYPARELPIDGVTSEIIFKDITAPQKRMVAKEDLAETIADAGFEILLTVGAGDINLQIPRIVSRVK